MSAYLNSVLEIAACTESKLNLFSFCSKPDIEEYEKRKIYLFREDQSVEQVFMTHYLEAHFAKGMKLYGLATISLNYALAKLEESKHPLVPQLMVNMYNLKAKILRCEMGLQLTNPLSSSSEEIIRIYQHLLSDFQNETVAIGLAAFYLELNELSSI